MSDWPAIDVPERVVFRETPLVLTLCQVRYSPVLSVSNPVSVAPFQAAIIDQYPLMEQINEQNLKVRVEGSPTGNQASLQSNTGSTNWRFSDVEDVWTVVLTQDFVTLETRAYREFGDFENRLERVLGALDKTIHPPVVLRVGLRYVDEIRLGEGGWKTAIRPELLGALAEPELSSAVVQSFQQLQFKTPDAIGVTLQHGFIPSGTAVSPRRDETPPDGPFYVLDVDVFEEFKPGELALKPRLIRERVRKYHDISSTLFRWSVTKEYTTTLGRIANGPE
jgi:uncharacterized protein (TIGR04255 family)